MLRARSVCKELRDLRRHVFSCRLFSPNSLRVLLRCCGHNAQFRHESSNRTFKMRHRTRGHLLHEFLCCFRSERLYENRPFIKIGEAVTHRERNVFVAISSEDCLRHEVSDARLFHCRDKIVLQVVLIIAVSIGCNMDGVYDCKLRRSCALSCETQIRSCPNDKSTNAVYKTSCFRLPRGYTLRAQAFLEWTRAVEICEFCYRSYDDILKCIS